MSALGITLRNVTKVYPENVGVQQGMASGFSDAATHAQSGKLAVSSISLDIREGDRVGIIGRNGAGKSTLLHLIAGLSSPTAGSINISGKITSIMTLGVGLREDFSGRENIYLDGEIQGKTRAAVDEVIDEIINFAELGEFIDRPVRTYSTGMKARLAFSMISHIEPEILIIDEALSVGDVSFSAKATRRIREICDRGKIVIVVSHSMQAIRDICNRCLWLENGTVVSDGSPDEVTRSYIDSVRVADEADLMDKFKGHIGYRSQIAGWSISDISFRCDNAEGRRLQLEAGTPLCIQVRAIAPLPLRGELRVHIVRLDEMVVFDEIFSVEDFQLLDTTVGLAIEMDSLILGPATYRLDAKITLADQTAAEGSTVFEVYALNPPTGGKPMLLYPVYLDTLPA